MNKGNTFSPDLAINGCTAAIRSGKWSGKGLAWAFGNRGNAYLAAGDHDHAIADYNDAIKLDSKFANAYNGRSLAYRAKGDFERALADHNEAIRLDPKLAGAEKEPQPKISGAEQTEAGTIAMFAVSPRTASYRFLDLFEDVFERVRSDYVDKIDDWGLIEGGIKSMLSAPSLASSDLDEKQLCANEIASRGERTQNSYAYKALNCFGNVFEQTHKFIQNHSDTISDQTLIETAISGMLAKLDPLSHYFDSKSFRDAEVQSRGEFGGLGIEVSMEEGLIKVVESYEEMPAAKAGVIANDIISTINDEPMQGLTLTQAVDKMRGPIHSKVKLTIMRKGQDKPIEVSLLRDIIRVFSVRSRVEGGEVGYIRLTQFNEQTTEGLKTAIAEITAKVTDEKLKGYILDLRNNQGGLLDQTISISDAFLERGEIVSTRGRRAAEWQRFNARPGDLTKGKPVIVLINGKTASGSEIVAAALQDNKRATIVGTRSYGNGTIQTIIPLGSGNGALRLTTARFFTPTGHQIQDQGITPDINVEQDVPDELKKNGDTNLQSYIPSHPKNDKALTMALDLLRGTRKHPAFPPAPKAAVPN